jgi:2-aminoadipate transaminase
MRSISRFYSKEIEAISVIASSSLEIPEASADVLNFASGLPDPRAIPVSDLREILIEVIEEYGYKALQYAPTRGLPELIKVLTRFVYKTRGLEASPENILITTGSQQALELVTRLFVNPREIVIVEEPSYILALNVFKLRNADIIGIAVDENGLRVDILEGVLKKLRKEGKRVKLIYTMPLYQNPSGISMSLDRRRHLLELAEEHDFLIVEDDAYALLGFDDLLTQALASEDRFGRVLYLSTLSKILAPGLRVGYLIAHEDVAMKLAAIKQVCDLGTSTLSQAIGAKAIEKNIIDKNIEHIKRLYKIKRDLMIEAIDEFFPKGIWRSSPGGGFYVWVKLNKDIDAEETLKLSSKCGVLFTPGKRFCINQDLCKDTMRLSFSNPSEDSIKMGIQILGDILHSNVKTPCY